MGLLVIEVDTGTYPLPLWGFSGIMKQITQMEHDMVKNPNWQEAKQLTLLQSWPWISTQKNRETNLAIGQGRT